MKFRWIILKIFKTFIGHLLTQALDHGTRDRDGSKFIALKFSRPLKFENFEIVNLKIKSHQIKNFSLHLNEINMYPIITFSYFTITAFSYCVTDYLNLLQLSVTVLKIFRIIFLVSVTLKFNTKFLW